MSIDWEHELTALLDDLSQVQDELLAVLEEKRRRLASGQLDEGSGLDTREYHVGQRLQACHDRRGALLAQAADEGLPGDSLRSLAGAMPAPGRGALGKQVNLAAARMRLLEHHSLANWVAAQRSLLHVTQLLEIIATGGRLQPTYGDSERPCSHGALVDHEA